MSENSNNSSSSNSSNNNNNFTSYYKYDDRPFPPREKMPEYNPKYDDKYIGVSNKIVTPIGQFKIDPSILSDDMLKFYNRNVPPHKQYLRPIKDGRILAPQQIITKESNKFESIDDKDGYGFSDVFEGGKRKRRTRTSRKTRRIRSRIIRRRTRSRIIRRRSGKTIRRR